jgi:hypothetical protein
VIQLHLLALLLVLQAFPDPMKEVTPDLRHILSNAKELEAVEIRYRIPGKTAVIHGNGNVVMQAWDTKSRATPQLLPTCRGTVPAADVRQLLETMLCEHLLDLPLKWYLIINGDDEDWRNVQLHSIAIFGGGGRARRMFSAGQYGNERQEIPRNFAAVEKVIVSLTSKAVPPSRICGISPAL